MHSTAVLTIATSDCALAQPQGTGCPYSAFLRQGSSSDRTRHGSTCGLALWHLTLIPILKCYLIRNVNNELPYLGEVRKLLVKKFLVLLANWPVLCSTHKTWKQRGTRETHSPHSGGFNKRSRALKGSRTMLEMLCKYCIIFGKHDVPVATGTSVHKVQI